MTFKDTAYTTEFLGAHTDNTYFTDPARLQLFHLLSHTNGDGGASLLVDGFRAASILREESPQDFEVLMSTNHPYHSSGNEDVCVQPAEQAPVLKVHPELQRLYQIRWNNYDRAAKKNWNWEEQVKWYTAARHWDEIIRRKDMEIWTQLEPGTALSKLLQGTMFANRTNFPKSSTIGECFTVARNLQESAGCAVDIVSILYSCEFLFLNVLLAFRYMLLVIVSLS